MRLQRQWVVALLSLCLAACIKAVHPVAAMNESVPFSHCTPLSVQKYIVLNNLKSTMPAAYYIYHAGRRDIILDRVFHSAGAGAGWSSQLSPRHASLFVLAAHHRFVFSCEYTAAIGKKVSCHPLLRVCQVMKQVVPKNMGSAWWQENQWASRVEGVDVFRKR